MAQQEEIVLWIDQRWKNAIEKHLKDETLQEHLENVLDELCNRLPEQEYERISRAIQSEAAAQRAEEEAARTYAVYHVTERGQDWYFKTSPGEELLAVGKKLRGYVTKGSGVAPDKFIGMFFGGQPITAKEFDALTALRMENTGKVRGVFDVNFDKREFSAVHIMDGWQTWAMRDVCRVSQRRVCRHGCGGCSSPCPQAQRQQLRKSLPAERGGQRPAIQLPSCRHRQKPVCVRSTYRHAVLHHASSGRLAAVQLCSLLRHIHSAGIADVGTSAAARYRSALS